MPEEKKKESFTFSDKIKDSKSNKAASKSFAKRISSRIGRDGKPRQTIFERTKRDAPFLIAALIALLLLPFLYKYSGSVKEETVLTPSSTETVFDPERYAFAPDIENPEGQISQLSGRDSLSLIKGFGSDSEEDEYSSSDEYDYKAEALAQRDAYKESASAKKLKADTNIDIEENTTNIYKKRARAGTRAAFKRATTKINPIGNGRAARTSGNPLGVGKWGGSLKGAAKKVKGDDNKTSPKPVSLQPLQAAGKPSRSAFGNPAAALRQSKDALGKSDAKQAILDAQMKPVEPGSFGGMTLGDAKFGGGSGNFDRKFNYQGKEPWWWDLMKTRSQALWQRKMQRKWNWEDWLDKWAQNILGKLMNCLVTGDDGGDVDHFLYAKEGDGKAAKCCGYKRAVAEPLLQEFGGKWGKDSCETLQAKMGKDKCKEAWEDAKEAKADMNFFQVRGACLGLAVGNKYGKGEPSLSVNCSGLDLVGHHYSVSHEGKARKWQKNTYIYVVARNYVPLPFRSLDRAEAYERNKEIGGKGIDPERSEMVGEMYANLKEKELTGLRLCSVFGNNLRATKQSAAGTAAIYTTTTEMLAEKYDLDKKAKAHLREMERAAYVKTNDLTIHDDVYMGERSPKISDRFYKEMEDYAVAHANSVYKSGNATWARSEEYDPESLDDACVIYQAQAVSLDWEKHFKPQVISLIAKMLKNRGLADEDRYQVAAQMFASLDLMFVGSMSSEHQLAHHRDILDSESLPMPFWEFKAAYLDRYGVTAKHKDTGDRSYIGNGKYRTDGEDTVYAEKCYFHNSVNLSCLDNTETPTAIVTFTGESYKGGKAGVYYENGIEHMQKDYNFTEEKKNIRVTAEFTPIANHGISGTVPQSLYDAKLVKDTNNQLVYRLTNIHVLLDPEKKVPTDTVFDAGRVTWKLYRGSNPEAIDSATCDYGLSGDIPNPGPVTVEKQDECATGGMDASEACCDKLHDARWEAWTYEDGECKEVKKDGDRSKKDKKPDNLIPDDDEDEDRDDEDENPDGSIIRLATVLSWIPDNGETDCRKDAPTRDEAKKETTFGSCGKVPGIEKNKREHCGEQDPLIMDSTAAADYAMKVIEAYNRTNPERKLKDEFAYGRFPTDGEFVDALFLAQELGDGSLANVPGDAVCELGRDMVRMSRDPHVGDMRLNLPTHYTSDYGGGKKYPPYFHNDLGAFLVYVTLNSQLYPADKIYSIRDNADKTAGQQETEDLRFLPNRNPGRFKDTFGVGNEIFKFLWRNYARSYVEGKPYRIWNTYKASLEDKRFFPKGEVSTNPPLKALVGSDISGLPYQDCGLNKRVAEECHENANKYRLKINPYLTEDGDFEPWEGNACSTAKDRTVPLADVLRYVTAVCTNGLDSKPHGVGSSTGDTGNSYGPKGQKTPNV